MSKTRARAFSNFRFVEDKRKNMSIATLQFHEFCQGRRDGRECIYLCTTDLKVFCLTRVEKILKGSLD